MARSGSRDFTLDRNDLIYSALRKAQFGTAGITNDIIKTAIKDLNVMIKAWQNEKIFLWAVVWEPTTLTASSVVVGTDGNDYECIRNHTSAATNKPITGANYTSYWEATGSTGSGSVWATSTSYTSISNVTLSTDIIGIEPEGNFLRGNGYDTPITKVSREEFMDYGTKTSEAPPTAFWFNRQHTPEIFLYPYPDDSTDVLHLQVIKKLQDFDAGGNEADFPEEWLEAIIFGLASRLAFENPKIERLTRNDLVALAETYKQRAVLGSSDANGVVISQDFRPV
jgi:hypothetical protein